VLAGNLTDARAIAKMVGDNKIAGFLPPMGVMVNLFPRRRRRPPGLVTKVDSIPSATRETKAARSMKKARKMVPIVELTEIDGEEYLFLTGVLNLTPVFKSARHMPTRTATSRWIMKRSSRGTGDSGLRPATARHRYRRR
jgi:hypothetical protein